MNRNRKMCLAIALFGALTLFSAPSLVAQSSTGMTFIDSINVIIPNRAASEIQSDLDQSIVQLTLARARKVYFEQLLSLIDSRFEAKKAEIDVIGKSISAAKKEKKDAEKVALESRKQSAELERNLIKSQRDLRKAEIDQAEAESKLAEARRKTLELEAQLAAERAKMEGTKPEAIVSQKILIRDLEGKVLEAQKVAAGVQENFATKDKQIIEKRLKFFQSQGKALGLKK